MGKKKKKTQSNPEEKQKQQQKGHTSPNRTKNKTVRLAANLKSVCQKEKKRDLETIIGT
jgi:hypothetical protein